MPRESVVDALNVIHRALRPGGILLDVHPTDAPSPLAVLAADQTATPLGNTEFAGTFAGDVEAAEDALVQQENDGHFTHKQEAEFDFVHHFTLDQWHKYLNAQIDDYVPFTDELTNAIHESMQTPETILTLGEHIKATSYRAR
jgi:hypothetical protein